MIFDIIRNGFSMEVVLKLLVRVFVVFCTLPVHEYAHALIATKLGDDTPRLKGRLTLAPLAHVDLMGALMIFLVGVGYAKPVPINPRKFKNPKAGMALTALAGPFSNIIMALFFMLLYNAFSLALGYSDVLIIDVARLFFLFAAQINISLAVFNLIPVPPLDGSRIINLIIPSKYYFKIMQYERYIVLGLFALIFLGILDGPINFASELLMRLISFIASLPFNLFF